MSQHCLLSLPCFVPGGRTPLGISQATVAGWGRGFSLDDHSSTKALPGTGKCIYEAAFDPSLDNRSNSTRLHSLELNEEK